METVVVYESMYGNTRMVAEAIGEGLRWANPGMRVSVLHVAEAPAMQLGAGQGAALLIVGSPTHIRRMPTAWTRKAEMQSKEASNKDKVSETEQHFEPGAAGPGVREWLAALPRAAPGARAVAFDTRLSSPLAGGAARSIARQLRHRGYTVADTPLGFVVDGSQGPLRAGELDRAREWGARLAGQLVG